MAEVDNNDISDFSLYVFLSLELTNGSITCKDYFFKRIRLMIKQTLRLFLLVCALIPRNIRENFSKIGHRRN